MGYMRKKNGVKGSVLSRNVANAGRKPATLEWPMWSWWVDQRVVGRMLMREYGGGEKKGLLGAHGQDFFASNSQFDAVGRADVAALDNGPTNPNVPGKIRSF